MLELQKNGGRHLQERHGRHLQERWRNTGMFMDMFGYWWNVTEPGWKAGETELERRQSNAVRYV